MYISFDRDKLTLMHVHPNQEIVWDLVYLEGCNSNRVQVANADLPTFLNNLTTLELRMFYRNIGGKDFGNPLADDLTLRYAIAQLVSSLRQVTVSQSNLHAQIAWAEAQPGWPDDSRQVYKYAHGASQPAPVADLFPLTGQPLTGMQEIQAQEKAPTAVKAYTPPVTPPPSAAPATAPARAARTGGPSQRPTIFRVADEMWEKAGKPAVKDEVLALRKQMMTVLENEHGVKKTTSSTALGDWMKQRLPGV